MSKALVPAPSFEAAVVHIREHHRLALNSASMAVVAAAIVGLELRQVQKNLKSAPGCTFDDWIDSHQDEIGFSRRTAFKYLALADNLKGAMLRREERSIAALLDVAPSQLRPSQEKTLLLAMRKSVDGKSLTDLYEDFEIVRRPHGASLKDARPGGGGVPPTEVPVAQQVTEQLDLFAASSEVLHRTVKVGKEDVLLIAHWPAQRLDEAIAIARRDLELLLQTRKAVRS